MNRILILLCCGLLCCGFSMPVSRNVDYSDPSGKSWKEAGTMPVSVTAAQQAWELALRREGWRYVKTISIDVSSCRHLEIWQKEDTALLLCLWSVSPGSSGYMWGTVPPNNR